MTEREINTRNDAADGNKEQHQSLNLCSLSERDCIVSPTRTGASSGSGGAHPFSATDIRQAGQQIAKQLRVGSSNPDDVISEIRYYDHDSQRLNQDIAAYEKAGALGGIQTLELNDCWFEASLAALANQADGPEKISQMITSGPNNEYIVTFPGDMSHPVTLSADEVNKNSQVTNTAEWGKVLEAAILKKDPDDCTNGGFAMSAIELLSGNKSGYAFVAQSNDADMAKLISSKLQEGKPVVVDSDQVVPGANGSLPADAAPPVVPPIVDGHTYAVTACDSETNTITLFNPWGTNDVAPGVQQNGVDVNGAGEISMSMNTFMHNFRQVSYGT